MAGLNMKGKRGKKAFGSSQLYLLIKGLNIVVLNPPATVWTPTPPAEMHSKPGCKNSKEHSNNNIDDNQERLHNI
uniref:Uncharacterized protein n=1 Tax=Magallana gigas TaxID=29159 RepID=K1QWB9_MAGGI